jgi:hypothetical protein
VGFFYIVDVYRHTFLVFVTKWWLNHSGVIYRLFFICHIELSCWNVSKWPFLLSHSNKHVVDVLLTTTLDYTGVGLRMWVLNVSLEDWNGTLTKDDRPHRSICLLRILGHLQGEDSDSLCGPGILVPIFDSNFVFMVESYLAFHVIPDVFAFHRMFSATPRLSLMVSVRRKWKDSVLPVLP